MALNEFQIEDYLKDLRSKRTFAFEESPVFDRFLQLLTLEPTELQEVLRQLMQERSIDTAVGKQLDIIGDIVGQPRLLLDSDLIPYFGYDGALLAQSYGTLRNTSTGGYYWDIRVPRVGDTLLNDDVYRLFIKAKVFKNNRKPTPENVLEFIKFVFNVSRIRIIEGVANVKFQVFSDSFSNLDATMLQYFVEKKYKSYFTPKAIGVNYDVEILDSSGITYLGLFEHNGQIVY